MRIVEPAVFCTASTRIDFDEMYGWLDYIGAKEFSFPEQSSNGECLVMAAAKRCYQSFLPGMNPNITKVREDMKEFIDNILRSRHGSVLEHVSFTFNIENISRVATAELNRHRAGAAISEGSMRYIRMEDIPFWMPESLVVHSGDSDHIANLKDQSRVIFRHAFYQDECNYNDLVELWDLDKLSWKDESERRSAFHIKKSLTSAFRRIIGIGVATGGTWTYNLRALRNIFEQRCAPEAEEEIYLIASIMLKKMQQKEPRFFGDFEEKDGFWYPKYHKV